MLQAIRSTLAVRTRLREHRIHSEARRLYRKYRPYTMILERDYTANVELAIGALADPILDGGAIVECGCWMGGMSAALVEVGGRDRQYYFFDSFEGLPPAQPIDGAAALRYQSDKASPQYRDNCAASLESFNITMALTRCQLDKIHPIRGFFEQSFPAFAPPKIAILRLDADWYESTIICLRKFWGHVLPGGLILIDDYYMWDGCSRAVHDFLSDVKAAERIRQKTDGLAFIIKAD